MAKAEREYYFKYPSSKDDGKRAKFPKIFTTMLL
jgi:hypothetical protein